MTRLESNRPTVRVETGEDWLCHLLGRTRAQTGRILVGDRVLVAETGPGQGAVMDILPRGVVTRRPPLANVTGLLVVVSLAPPHGSLELLDRRLVLAEALGLSAVIVATKTDLLDAAHRDVLAAWSSLYQVVWTGLPAGIGVEALRDAMTPGIWVLSGESGVGKSTLVNALAPEAQEARTGTLGRTDRGRQTTRVVSLHPVSARLETWLADTPGFAQLELPRAGATEVAAWFPEIGTVVCRFLDCRHQGDEGCGMPEAVRQGFVHPQRLQDFLRFTDEARAVRARYPGSGRKGGHHDRGSR